MLSNYDKQIKKQKDWTSITEKSADVKFGRVEVIIKEGQIERFEITEQHKPEKIQKKRPELETQVL